MIRRLLCLTLLATALPAHAGDIGTATAVVPDARGTLEGGEEQVLEAGSALQANERITCGSTGQAQLVFADGTSLNVGSGSDLVLDKYVYDPSADTGEMVTSMGKGVLRFVGGRISKKRKVTVKTPVGTVGIRGGIAVVSYDPGGELEAIFLYGDAMTVTAAGGTRTVRRSGLAVRVAPGARPSAPRPVKPENLGRAMGRLDRQGPPRGTPPPSAGRLAGLGAPPPAGPPPPGAAGRPGPPRPGAIGPTAPPPPGGPPLAGNGSLPPRPTGRLPPRPMPMDMMTPDDMMGTQPPDMPLPDPP